MIAPKIKNFFFSAYLYVWLAHLTHISGNLDDNFHNHQFIMELYFQLKFIISEIFGPGPGGKKISVPGPRSDKIEILDPDPVGSGSRSTRRALPEGDHRWKQKPSYFAIYQNNQTQLLLLNIFQNCLVQRETNQCTSKKDDLHKKSILKITCWFL